MILRGLMLALFVSWTSLAYAVDEDRSTPHSTPYERATAFYRQGNFPEALAIFRQLAADHPSDSSAQKDLMWTLWNAGQFDDAGTVADKVLQLAPGDLEAKMIADRSYLTANRERILRLRIEAAALVRAGRNAEAADVFHELVSIDGYNYRLLKDAMWANLNADRHDEAVTLARRILTLRSDDNDAIGVIIHAAASAGGTELYARLPVGAQIRVALALADSGHVPEALTLLDRLQREYPDNADVLRYRCSITHKAGLFDDGLRTALHWTQIKPSDSRSWYWLATLQLDLGQGEAAEASFEKSLGFNPNQPATQLAVGRFYLADRQFAKAISFLERARAGDPALAGVYPLLAKGYYWTQQYEKSAELWAKAMALFPSRIEYRFSHAQALYYAGHRDDALAEMRELAKDPTQPAAFLFLVDDATAHHDRAAAIALLEKRLQRPLQPSDEPLVLRLCDLYDSGHDERALDALTTRFMAVSPNSQAVLLEKGNALYAKKDYKGCAAINQKILAINPNDVDALQTIAACYRAMGHTSAELAALHHLREIDPTNPAYLLLDAEARYDDGQTVYAKKIISDWETANSTATILAVLLYHGLTPFKDDPILAYPYHTTIDTFEKQLQGLLSAGYTPVTADQVSQWYHQSSSTLPSHPLLVSFDDGRLDSYLYGDPVVSKLGIHATMFAALVNAEGLQPPGFLTWPELTEAAHTGRWTIESHGDQAHLHVPTDANGGDGLFLVNREWKASEKRLETVDEWKARVGADYQSSYDKILKHTGHGPVAYAHPEGIYGQQGVVNTPEAMDVNLALTAKTFTTAYTQDHSGLNLRTRDPYHLKRLEPDNTWSANQLLQQLHDQDPRIAMISQLLDWAAAEGRTNDAEMYRKELETRQVSRGVLLSKQAEIALASGDLTRGRELTQQALALGDFPDLRRTLADAERQQAWSYDAAVTYEEDSDDRRSLLFEQALRTNRMGPWRFGVRQQWGWYRDNGAGHIFNDGLGLEAQYKLGLYHTFTAVLMGQGMSSPASNTFTATAAWEAHWQHHVTTVFEGGQRYVPTASAIADDIYDRYAEGRAVWDINPLWRLGSDDRLSNFTDGNHLISTQEELSRLIWSPINLRAVYQLTYENASLLRPQYYSPQDLIVNAIGPEWSMRFGSHTTWWARYLPGYATEDHQGGQFVHTVDTYVDFEWFADTLEPSFSYYQTPNYHERLYRLEWVHRF